MDLARKKELILAQESAFATAVGSAAVEKPQASFWMVLMPFLFIFFIHDMLRFKNNRRQFEAEFMANRRQALEVAFKAVETGTEPDIDWVVRKSACAQALAKPYSAWVGALVEYYMDLLAAGGDSFDELVRSAFHGHTNYLLTLNRLNTAEKRFFQELKTCMAATEDAADVIAVIQDESQRLRRELAGQIFA